MTLLPGESHLPEIFFQLDLGRWVDSRWALPQISSFFSFLSTVKMMMMMNCAGIVLGCGVLESVKRSSQHCIWS